MQLKSCVPTGNAEQEPGYLISFEYNADGIEHLKAAIPHISREWQPETKTWWVSVEYEAVLTKFFANFEALTKWQQRMF